MKKGLIFTAILAIVPALVFSQTSYTVRNVAGWIEAVNGIRNGGNNKDYSIAVTGTISVPPSAESTFGSVTGITVIIEGSGALSPSSNGTLLQIGDGQTIIAKNVTLRGRSDNGSYSVVIISSEGIFRMEGKTSVTGNKNSGVYNSGTFTMQDNASVSDNNGYGIVVNKSGTFTMQGNASVTGNGGGVYIDIGREYGWEYDADAGGTFTMQGSALVKGNAGIGVYVDEKGTFTMLDSALVSGNTSSNNYSSGGVYNKGTFTMRDKASVSGNTSSSSSFRAEGTLGYVYVSGTSYGGGVYNSGTFTMQNSASVSGNITTTNTSTSSYGGGVYNSGTFTMQDSVSVSGNTSSSKSSSYSNSYGGGVYNSGTFTMQDSASVSGNISSSVTASYGGGVYVAGGNFTMHKNSSVSDNTCSSSSSSSYGGGVYVAEESWNTSVNFTMQGSASVSGNISSSSSSYGGGVYNGGTFSMQGDTSVSGNKTNINGGGVYVASGDRGSGTFIMQDRASILGNTADNGGGVYVTSNGTFTKTGGTIYGNDEQKTNTAISGKGYAIYEAKNRGWRNATAGQTMNPDSYGFWLNEEAVAIGFSSGFIGIWKRSNFNNTLTFTSTTVKSSSRDNAWKFISVSGDAYILEANTAAKTRMTLTIKLVNGNIVISGDSGNGENNWNGTWIKQRQ